jgi:hypothetical protein
MTAKKLDIFTTLGQIDRKNYLWYDNLSEEEQKAFVPLVVNRWLSGTASERQIIFINEFVNPHLFNLNQHKGLLFKLMCVAADGGSQRYKWLKQKPKSNAKPLSTAVVQEYYSYSVKQAKDVLRLLTAEDVVDLASALGRDKSDITKMKKEMK